MAERAGKDRLEWRNEALERLQKELEEELRDQSGLPLRPEEVERIGEKIRLEIGERIKVRFEDLKKEIIEDLVAERKRDVKAALAEGELFLRFGVNIRIQHFFLAVSLILLIVSGLPLRFHDSVFFKFIIFLLGGIDNSTFIHRLAAGGLMVISVWHLCWLTLTNEGRKEFWELLPKPKDVLDMIQNIKYFLRISREKALFDRFSYIEKFDYWAVYWGVVIMVGSGLLLWLEETALRFFPKYVLDVAKEMHRDEALLATLAIVIWHMYNAHLNPHKFPGTLVIWNGLTTREEMLDEHPVELERRTGATVNKHGNS